jgi:hypothetical protein
MPLPNETDEDYNPDDHVCDGCGDEIGYWSDEYNQYLCEDCLADLEKGAK